MIKPKTRNKPVNGPLDPETRNYTSRPHKSILRQTVGLLGAIIALSLAVACGTPKEIPVKTEIIVRDSLIYRERIDTTWITLPPVYVKDYTALRDTLRLEGKYERAWASVNEEKDLLEGGIETINRPVPVQTIEREKIIKKDSLIFKEIPIEVERQVRYIPKWVTWSLIMNILMLVGIFIAVYLKLNKSAIF